MQGTILGGKFTGRRSTGAAEAMDPDIKMARVDTLWTRSERSIAASGSQVGPGPQTELCAIQGFQTWEQDDIYRLDYEGAFATTGISFDLQIQIAGVPYFTLPISSVPACGPCKGTLFLAPNSDKIALVVVTGGVENVHYLGSLILTRMPHGFQIG